MWTNRMLKQNAWSSLKHYYWQALGVILVAGILGANTNSGANMVANFLSGAVSSYSSYENSPSQEGTPVPPGEAAAAMGFVVITALLFSLIAFLVTAALKVFLGNPVSCGECGYFCDARNGRAEFSRLFGNFMHGNYMPTVKTMFFRDLYISLWTLLFVIPGIIKAYEYALIPYLLAENPYLPRERAFELSKKAMKGEKLKLFWLELSFIGWYFLGTLCLYFGVLFVVPYQQATLAEFYQCMRAKMISYGYTTEEELTGGYGGYGGGYGYGGGNPYNSGNPYNGGFGGGNNTYGGPYSGGNNTYSGPYSSGNGSYGNPYGNSNPYGSGDGSNDPNNPYYH